MPSGHTFSISSVVLLLLTIFSILPQQVSSFSSCPRAPQYKSQNKIISMSSCGDGNMNRIFVYGSLLSGLHNHVVLTDLSAKFLYKAISKDKFYLTGLKSNEYPYLSMLPLHPSQEPSTIQGEVYEVTSSAIAALDSFECHPDEYLRTEIEVVGKDTSSAEATPIKAYSYLLCNEKRINAMRLHFDQNLVTVANGDWKTHHLEKLKELGDFTDTRLHLK